MEKQLEEKNTEMGSIITRSEEFIEKNQKALIIAIVAIVVVVLAIFGLRRWYFQPREERAAAEMFAAEQWFAQGDYDKALNGSDVYRGFLSVIDDFGGTKAGNLAKYYTGMTYLRMGEYAEAERWLKKYSGKDTFTPQLAEMQRGDAAAEQGDFAAALTYYKKAARMADNYIVTPSALFKAGLVCLQLGDNTQALDHFNDIKTNYIESTEWQDIDKYIAIAENGK